MYNKYIIYIIMNNTSFENISTELIPFKNWHLSYLETHKTNPIISLISLNNIWFSQSQISLNSDTILEYFSNTHFDVIKIDKYYLITGFFGYRLHGKIKPQYIPIIEVVELYSPCFHYTTLNNRRLYIILLAVYLKHNNPNKKIHDYKNPEELWNIVNVLSGSKFEINTTNIYVPCIIYNSEYNKFSKRYNYTIKNMLKDQMTFENYVHKQSLKQLIWKNNPHKLFGNSRLPVPYHLNKSMNNTCLKEDPSLNIDKIEKISEFEVIIPKNKKGKRIFNTYVETNLYNEMIQIFKRNIKNKIIYKSYTKKHKCHKKSKTLKMFKENHIIEIIRNTRKPYKIFDKEDEAIKYLEQLTANIRLDYHGVLDIIPPDIPLLTENRELNSICAISFVGRTSPTRTDVRNDLMLRIKNNQIDFGILIFNRGNTKNKNIFTSIGSKAWVNKHISCHSPKKCLFLDDSNDHIRSTQYLLGNEIIHAELFNTYNTHDLIKKIKDYAI
jgi:hypothetical protein